MAVQKKINLKNKLLRYLPLILLYISVLNEFDIDASNLNILSFNLPFIIIFYWSLKDPDYISPALKGVFVWQSGWENKKDPQDEKIKLGVQITPIKVDESSNEVS